jgi:predicted transcriptional regulator
MHPPPETRPRHRRYSVRRQARVDAETQAKLEELAHTFHRKRAAILRYVMEWALAHTQGWTIDPSNPDRPHLLHMPVDPELLQQVQDAAAAHGADVAAWERHAMRLLRRDDFPPSWHVEAAQGKPRSHDSRDYGRKFTLRFDAASSTKLEQLVQRLDRPAAEIIRQLIVQAKPEDFPPSWRMAVDERRQRETRNRKGAR